MVGRSYYLLSSKAVYTSVTQKNDKIHTVLKPLQRGGNYIIYCQMQHKTFFTQCICVFRMILTINNHHVLIQYPAIIISNGSMPCSL